jgi:hypothetical protein
MSLGLLWLPGEGISAAEQRMLTAVSVTIRFRFLLERTIRPHRLGVAPGLIQVSPQHVQAIAQRIRADAFRLRRLHPLLRPVCPRFGCHHALFGPVSALAFGLPCPISLFGALAEFGNGRF